jgi:FtsP/CotA-like multicopper oxidase with cupredoxin domain
LPQTNDEGGQCEPLPCWRAPSRWQPGWLRGPVRDTSTLPPARNGQPGEVKVVIPFVDPTIVGRFVFHCHVVKHEDKGRMQTLEVRPP